MSVVLKVGGASIGSTADVVRELRTLGHSVVVVHGAGPQISEEMKRRGLEVRFVDGRPSGDEPALTNGHCEIEIDLALGDGAANYLTSDLSYDYVRINAEYRT